MLLQPITRPQGGVITVKILAFFLACLALSFKLSQEESTVSAFQIINGANCFNPPQSLPDLAISPQTSMPWSVAYRLHMYAVMKTCDQMFGALKGHFPAGYADQSGLPSIRPEGRHFYQVKGKATYRYDPVKSEKDSTPYTDVVPGARNIVVVIQTTKNLFNNSVDEVIQSLLYTIFTSGRVERGDYVILAAGPIRYQAEVGDQEYSEIIEDPHTFNVRYFVYSARDLCYLMAQMYDSFHDYLSQFTGERDLFDINEHYAHVTFDKLLQRVSIDLLHDALLFHSDNVEGVVDHVFNTLPKWIGPKEKFDFSNIRFSELTKMVGMPPIMSGFAYKTHRLIGLSIATRGTLLIGFVDSYTSAQAQLNFNYVSPETGYCSDIFFNDEVEEQLTKNYKDLNYKELNINDFELMGKDINWKYPEDYFYTFTRSYYCNTPEHALRFTALNLVMAGIEKFIFFDYLGSTNTEYQSYEEVDLEDNTHRSIVLATQYYTDFIGCPNYIDSGTKSFSDVIYSYMCKDIHGSVVNRCSSLTNMIENIFNRIGTPGKNERVVNFYTSGDLMDPRIVPHYYLRKISEFIFDSKLNLEAPKVINCNNATLFKSVAINAKDLSNTVKITPTSSDPVQRVKILNDIHPDDVFDSGRYYWHLGYNSEYPFKNFLGKVRVSNRRVISNYSLEMAILARSQNEDFAYSLIYGWSNLALKLLA